MLIQLFIQQKFESPSPFLTRGREGKRRIQNPVKHLRWGILQIVNAPSLMFDRGLNTPLESDWGKTGLLRLFKLVLIFNAFLFLIEIADFCFISSGIYLFTFEVVLVFLSLTLNWFHTLFWCFHCCFYTSNYQLGRE